MIRASCGAHRHVVAQVTWSWLAEGVRGRELRVASSRQVILFVLVATGGCRWFVAVTVLVGGKQDGLLGWAAVTEVPAGVGLVPAVPHLGGWEAMGKVRVAVGPISGVGCTAKLAPAEGRGKADGV